MIDIGHMIRTTLRDQGHTVLWFAKEMSCSRNNVYKIFNSSTINTQTLLRISRILKTDFFKVYSDELWNDEPQCNQ